MAKLYFYYSAMNAGKTTTLLQSAHNYEERGMNTVLMTAALDNRDKIGLISSRIGLKKQAQIYEKNDNLWEILKECLKENNISCILIDEAQFLTEKQVWELSTVVDDLNVPVLCYGLRTDYAGQVFPGSKCLLAIADTLIEIKTICHCGKKASMNLRYDENKKPVIDGEQIVIGGNDVYEALCRKCFINARQK